MEDLITVIVPVYNVEKYVRECVHSIIAQSYQNLEILLVNDGSTDSSPDILKQLAPEDRRITVLDKPNGGLSDARNYGLDRASGKYVLFVDADDVIDKEMCKELHSAMQKEKAQIGICDMEYFYEDGSTKPSDGGDFTVSSVIENPSLIAINNSACNKLYEISLFDSIRFPKGKWYEDLYTVPTLLYEAGRIVKVNRPYYHYRQRMGSIAHSSDPRIFDIYEALDHVKEYVEAHGHEESILTQIHHLYVVHGLELTTLRIRDFQDKDVRVQYLKENMEHLKKSCPDYKKDERYQKAGFKKKIIYGLLNAGRFNQVLKIYDR